uniref:HMG box domain-containing protein n=1 Tax=Panagrolaimus superbus TaxID=310955 RepID=A0A914Y6X5_9BILA
MSKNGGISPSTPPSLPPPPNSFNFLFPPVGYHPFFFNSIPVFNPFVTSIFPQHYPSAFSASLPSSSRPSSQRSSESPLNLSLSKQKEESGSSPDNNNNNNISASPLARSFPFPFPLGLSYNSLSSSSSLSSDSSGVTFDHLNNYLPQQQQRPRCYRSPKPANHIKRPMNAFMIWSRDERKRYLKEFPDKHNSQVSKELGLQWRAMSEEEKKPFFDEQKRLHALHQMQYPNYRYCPRPKRFRNKDGRNMDGDDTNDHCVELLNKILSSSKSTKSPSIIDLVKEETLDASSTVTEELEPSTSLLELSDSSINEIFE